MKLAYMYATPDVNHSNVTAIQGAMAETLQTIKQIGYTGVEFLVRDPREVDQQRLREIVSELELDVPAICTGEVYGEDLVSFASPEARIRSEAVDRMMACMELAEHFSAMVNVGRLRGRYEQGIPQEQTMEWIRDAIVRCARQYPKVPIVIEPVNRQYANCMLNTRETLDFVKEINLPNVGMMLDLVHMLVEEEQPGDSMELAKPYFWHFHICDSDRLPAGLGEYNLAEVMQTLTNFGFDRYVTVESFQQPSADVAIKTSFATLQPYFA